MAGTADVIQLEAAWGDAPWGTVSFDAITDVSASERPNRGSVEFTITKGRTGDAGGLFVPSTLTATVRNNDADWDEENSGSAIGPSNLVRNTRIRALVPGAEAFTLFDGYISDIAPVGDQHSGVAVITARDLLGLLAEYDVDGLVRPMELTGQRVTAILDDIGLPGSLRSTIENGNVLMPAATLEGDALSLLQQCARAEYGFLYASAAGSIRFYDRYRPLSSAWSTRVHSFTASGSGTLSKLHRSPIQRSLGDFRNVTRVTATRNGSDKVVEYDNTSANYPPTTPTDGPYSLDVAWDADLDVAAQAWHDGWKFDGERIRSFRVLAYPDHSAATTAIRQGYYEPMNRVEVQCTPAGFSTDFNFEARIEQVTHTVGLHEWTVDVTVSPYFTRWQDNGASLWYEYGTTLSGSDLGGL